MASAFGTFMRCNDARNCLQDVKNTVNQLPDNDPRKAKLQAVAKQLTSSDEGLAAVEKLDVILKKDPSFAAKFKDLALNNTDALSQAAPDILRAKTDAELKDILIKAGEPKPQPQAAPVPPSAPAGAPGARPEPAPTVPPVVVAAALTMDQKLEAIQKNGGMEMLKEIENSSPEGHKLFDQILNGIGPDGKPTDPKNREAIINGLYERSKDNPKFFDDMTNMIKTNKGAASTMFSRMAANPAQGLGEMDQALGAQKGPGGSMFEGGFMSILTNLFKPGGMQAMIAELKGMFDEIKTMVAGLFGGSKSIDTDNPKLAGKALAATGSDATLRSIETGEVIAEREREARRGQTGPSAVASAQPGITPGMSPSPTGA